MGVPITILGLQYSDGYIHMLDYMSNEMRYEIIGMACDKRDKDPCFVKFDKFKLDDQHTAYVGPVVNGKATYARILIKKILADF